MEALDRPDPLRKLAELTRLAETNPAEAAREYWVLTRENPVMVTAMVAFAKVPEADVKQFEASGPDLLVLNEQVGRFWLCPAKPKDFDGHEPWVTLRGMRALAKAYVALLKANDSDDFFAAAFES